jgi:hypothetical protein
MPLFHRTNSVTTLYPLAVPQLLHPQSVVMMALLNASRWYSRLSNHKTLLLFQTLLTPIWYCLRATHDALRWSLTTMVRLNAYDKLPSAHKMV